jgi:hypothetical protein
MPRVTFCIYCGGVPGSAQNPCPGRKERHKWSEHGYHEDTLSPVYCSHCGGTPGSTKNPCLNDPNKKEHRWIYTM